MSGRTDIHLPEAPRREHPDVLLPTAGGQKGLKAAIFKEI